MSGGLGEGSPERTHTRANAGTATRHTAHRCDTGGRSGRHQRAAQRSRHGGRERGGELGGGSRACLRRLFLTWCACVARSFLEGRPRPPFYGRVCRYTDSKHKIKAFFWAVDLVLALPPTCLRHVWALFPFEGLTHH